MAKKMITLQMVSDIIGTKFETLKRWPKKRKMVLKLGVLKMIEMGIVPDPRLK